MKTAYLDCFSGISGDMFLGALLDAGLPFKDLSQAIGTLPLTGYTLNANKEKRNGLMGTRFLVYSTGTTHPHRGLDDIKAIIQKGALSTQVKETSIQIFESIAIEEAKIHGRPVNEIHFHEVGAVDSIIDIVGVVFGIEFLQITSLMASPLPVGSGFVETQHGRIPVPAPATIALLKGIPIYQSGLSHELVTPTGAALIRKLASAFGVMPPMMVDTVGYGVGSRELSDRPNLFRILVGREHAKDQVEAIVVLEANLDDMNPEWLGFMMEQLFEAGALDVVFYPIQMKKNRPGVHVEVIGNPKDKDALMKIFFRESTTLGIRFDYVQRAILQRSITQIDSPWGKIGAKQIIHQDGTTLLMPEYEACREIAQMNDMPLKRIYDWVLSNKKGEAIKESSSE
ncbi:MAG: nickel pincer cofactor biosynthesis protein LarC [Deltaproteobacteria bacterium]|nr:nickel pincer cofactor biosynthesis protein LarC [Deltaproteobacteria bacterium]